MTIEVIEGTLPRDFKAEDTEELVLQLDVFNSLGGQWENKPVTVNGVVVGNLPVTGQTLRWHEAMPLKVTGGPAREIVSRGVRPDGAVELRVEIGNEVRNCFKLRNAVAVIRTHGGGVVQSVRSRAVHCSDPGWLYSEGAAVPLGRTVGVGPVRFERKE
jgi:hypothetical protein